MRRIGVVVEGDGDQGAIPVIIRGHLQRRAIYDVMVAKPINAKGRSKLLRPGELERFARLASLPTGTAGVLVVCDADEDPACELGPSVSERCFAAVPHVPIRACLATREFENWLLASAKTGSPRRLGVKLCFFRASARPWLPLRRGLPGRVKRRSACNGRGCRWPLVGRGVSA